MFHSSADIDECEDDINSCHPDALCTNVPGSHVCRCRKGFEGDGSACVGKNIFSYLNMFLIFNIIFPVCFIFLILMLLLFFLLLFALFCFHCHCHSRKALI